MSGAGDGTTYPVVVGGLTCGSDSVLGWDNLSLDLPRVTQIISSTSDKGAALSGWAFNLATEGVTKLANEGEFTRGGVWTQEEIKELLKDRNYSPYQQKTLAATRGKGVHRVFEEFLNTGTTTLEGVPTGMQGYARAALAWAIEAKPKVLATEATVASLRHGYAGTLDLLCELDGVTTVVDLKTSKRIYETHAIQMAAYRLALKEVGVEVAQAGVLRVTSEATSQFKVYDSVALDALEDQWLAMLKLWESRKRKGAA